MGLKEHPTSLLQASLQLLEFLKHFSVLRFQHNDLLQKGVALDTSTQTSGKAVGTKALTNVVCSLHGQRYLITESSTYANVSGGVISDW